MLPICLFNMGVIFAKVLSYPHFFGAAPGLKHRFFGNIFLPRGKGKPFTFSKRRGAGNIPRPFKSPLSAPLI